MPGGNADHADNDNQKKVHDYDVDEEGQDYEDDYEDDGAKLP